MTVTLLADPTEEERILNLSDYEAECELADLLRLGQEAPRKEHR